MVIRSLQLHNFRNYATQHIELPAGLIALIGDNGQGKTNLLEALCVLATTKSPLVERDRELIRWEQSEARLAAQIELEGGRGETRYLEYSWRASGNTITKEMRAGGLPQSVIGEWLGQLQVVAFFPHDLTLVTGEPDERRRFLNVELGKAKPLHLVEVGRYRRALQQRNALLRQYLDARFKSTPPPEPGALSEWNKQLISYGARVMAGRARFLEEIEPLADAMHRKLSGLDKKFSVEYCAGLKLSKRFEREVLNSEGSAEIRWSHLLQASPETDPETDRRRGTTGSGPHRDDLVFNLDGMDLKRFGSQGQQRLGVLAVKLALAHWVRDATGEPPILLLDDALSELDATRRALVLEEAQKFPQSVLTATDARFVREIPSAIFSVAGGRVRREESPSPSEATSQNGSTPQSTRLVEATFSSS
jgi:DNA replication and repair protein RecF